MMIMKRLMSALTPALSLVATATMAQTAADSSAAPNSLPTTGFCIKQFGGMTGLGVYSGGQCVSVPIAPTQLPPLADNKTLYQNLNGTLSLLTCQQAAFRPTCVSQYGYANVAWWGAIGDGITDNSSAIQNAINYMEANYLSGTVIVPSAGSKYCVGSGLTIHKSGVRFLGTSRDNSIIAACGHNITVLSMGAGSSSPQALGQKVSNISFYGTGWSDASTLGNQTKPVISYQNCSECVIRDTVVFGGRNAVFIDSLSADYILENLKAQYAYGNALVEVHQGGWLKRDKLDQYWGYNSPSNLTAGTQLPTWAANTNYAAGAAVLLSTGWVLQTQNGGTSGASEPASNVYGVNIPDGNTIWQLQGPYNYYSLQMDTGASEVQLEMVDMSGMFSYGIGMTNTYNGTAPSILKVSQGTIGATTKGCVNLAAGKAASFTDLECGHGYGGTGILITSNWTGDLTLQGGTLFAAGGVGVWDQGGINLSVSNVLFESATYAVRVSAGVGSFSILGSHFGGALAGGVTNAIVVDPGASDHYNIIGNICQNAGSCVTDGGTGTHKTVFGNN